MEFKAPCYTSLRILEGTSFQNNNVHFFPPLSALLTASQEDPQDVPSERGPLYHHTSEVEEPEQQEEEVRRILALLVAVALDPGTTGTFVTWTDR